MATVVSKIEEPQVEIPAEVNAQTFFDFIRPRYTKFGYKGLALADHSSFRALITNDGFEQRLSHSDGSKNFVLNERSVFSRPHDLGIDILFERDLRDGEDGFSLITVPDLTSEQAIMDMYRTAYKNLGSSFNPKRYTTIPSAVSVLRFDDTIEGFFNENVHLRRVLFGVEAIATSLNLDYNKDCEYGSFSNPIILNGKKSRFYKIAKALVNLGHRMNGFEKGRWHIPDNNSPQSLAHTLGVREKWNVQAREYFDRVKERLEKESNELYHFSKKDMSDLRLHLIIDSGFELRNKFPDPNTRYWPFTDRYLCVRPSNKGMEVFFEGKVSYYGKHINDYSYLVFKSIGGPGGYEEFERNIRKNKGKVFRNIPLTFDVSESKNMSDAVKKALKIE